MRLDDSNHDDPEKKAALGDFVACTSRWRTVLLTLGCAVFVALGLWMGGAVGSLPDPPPYPSAVMTALGWTSVIFFGLVGIFYVKALFGTGEQLRIGPAGVRWARWSDQTIPWHEITAVTTWQYQGEKSIILHLRDRSRFPGRGPLAVLAPANRMLTGGDICISMVGTDRGFDDAFSAIAHFRS